MTDSRLSIQRARRVVVKVGSNALADHPDVPAELARQIGACVHAGYSMTLVTSGAIAVGYPRLGYRSRPREMARLQAAAAAGQIVLMRRYDEAFAAVGVTAAQVLLTHSDLSDRERANNARHSLAALLDAGAVPIINENDAVSTDEIRFGDNDQLAAMVAPLVGAELLILLTNVDGVLDARRRRISVLTDAAKVAKIETGDVPLGTGGMESKLDAARKAARSGASVVIATARQPDTIARILKGQDIGTLVPVSPRALRARKHWIAYTLRPRGTIVVDNGAVRALSGGRSSLLPVGVIGVRGDFRPGDAVSLVCADGTEIGRGLARLGALDVARAAGKRAAALEMALGIAAKDLVVVHKDDLVTEL